MLRKVTQSCRLYQKRIEENISRYASHYVSQAIGTLPFKLGQNVMWKMIASDRGDQKLERKFNGHEATQTFRI